MNSKIIPHEGCCDDFVQPGLLSVDEARARVIASVRPVTETESVPLREALGRVLAEDVLSPVNVPGHTNSAMDGYAVSSSDLPGSGTRQLKLVGTSWAGKPCDKALQSGETIRIMTGAAVPAGADTVIMQEQVETGDGVITIGSGHRPGQNIRAAGEDLAKGQLALSAGRHINAADLGLLGSLGLERVNVFRRLRVAVLDMGIVVHTREAVEQAFHEAAASADVLITTGGVSVGDADYVTETLEKLGRTNFWRIAMKPGRPLAFGEIGDCVFFGLPGNPVSAMVTFIQFVRPALLCMAGNEPLPEPLIMKATALTTLKKSPGRAEFQRGVLARDEQGKLTVSSTGAQGSGILRSMSEANCFVVLAAEQATVNAGETVDVQPFTDAL